MEFDKIGGLDSHRHEREAGRLVYPVFSRRSGGLSLGINLFPEAKRCSFDCPYCEVFPLEAEGPARHLAESPQALMEELEGELRRFSEEFSRRPPDERPAIRDIALSGNGEPSLSPFLEEALALCARERRRNPGIFGGTDIVLITNSTGFLDPDVVEVLHRCVREEGLVVWAKLDAGDQGLFERMTRSDFSLAEIVSGIEAFARRSPVVIQTMLCALAEPRAPGSGEAEDKSAIPGIVLRPPAPSQLEAYADILASLVSGGAKISEFHLYTKSRPSPESVTGPIPDDELRAMADLVHRRLPDSVATIPFRVFGHSGELRSPLSATLSGDARASAR